MQNQSTFELKMPDAPMPTFGERDDGSKWICAGNMSHIVGSDHLIEPRIHQPRTTWLHKNSNNHSSRN